MKCSFKLSSFSFLKNPGDVLKAVKFMVSTQISREPLVRKVLREAFFERAKLNVIPTKKGIKEIDENHPCFRYCLLLFLKRNRYT